MKNWSAPISHDEVCRRAGGRNRYNAWRRFVALDRRIFQVAPLLKGRWFLHIPGLQAKIAREIGVSESTISRDIQALKRTGEFCQTCGSYHSTGSLLKPIRNGSAR